MSKNYLAHARCLVDSFLDHHPDGRAFVLLTDRVDGYFDPGSERFVVIPIEDLGIPDFKSFSFRYTQMELNTAAKPFFLEHLFQMFNLKKLFYFDPDILIAASLDRLSGEFGNGDILLTPHLLDGLEDGRYPGELDILRAGAFNLGFIGLTRCDEVFKLLQWWQRKLLYHCSAAPELGLFVDQRWIDLVPSLFAGVSILREPGYNVAYWNLSQRAVKRSGVNWLANGTLVSFFHFSGFNPDNVHEVSRHQNRLTLDDIPELQELFVGYRDRLRARGHDEMRNWPYAYAAFDDGVPVPDAARRAYREADPEGTRWPNPFLTDSASCFRSWLNQDADPRRSRRGPVTRFALQVYRERPDLQKVFPDVLDQHGAAFSAWFAANAESQLGLAPCFSDPMRQSKGKRRLGPTELPEREMSGSPVAGGEPRTRAGAFSDWRRALLVIAFRLNGSWVGRGFRWLAGRGASLRLKQALLALGGQPSRSLVSPGQAPAPVYAAIRPERCKGDTAQGLNVIGYLRSENGIGEIARGTMRALTRVGYPVAKTSIEINDLARKEEDSCCDVPDGTPYPVTLFHVNADQVPTVVDALGHELMAGRRNIGYWFWETSSFPVQWLDRFQYFDEIWVASSFLQATLAPLSPVPVIRMRPCVEVKPALGVGRSEFGLPEDKFLFLFVFDPFSVPERKNPLGLVEAYRRAFGTRPEKTMLVLKVNQLDRIPGFEANLGIDEGWATRFVESVTSVSGKVVDRYLRRDELHALFNACDAFVSLHRSEGFGLTMAEAMLLGKPCIGTAYSANMEFMTPANSYLVDYRMQELDRDFGPYTRGTVWAEPDLDHAAALMRYVFEHREEARLRGATAQENIGRFYGARAVGQQIAARLELLNLTEAVNARP